MLELNIRENNSRIEVVQEKNFAELIGTVAPPTGGGRYTAVYTVFGKITVFILLVSPSSSQWDQVYPS